MQYLLYTVGIGHLVFMMSNVLEFRPTTVEDVKKEHGLDKPGMMEQAIDMLYEWIQKQEHFFKKDFCREYLERIIISSKGSVERAKVRMDNMCTMRTHVPELFSKTNVKQDFSHLSNSHIFSVYMPKLTEDNYRIYINQYKKDITTDNLMDLFRIIMIFGEYLKRYDYANGYILLIDIRENNIMDLVAQINIVDLSNVVKAYTDGFGFRIKNIFIMSNSKVIDVFTSLLRRVLSAKLGQRITVLKSFEDLHDQLPKKLLPKDYGGQQKSLMELYVQWTEEVSSKEFIKYATEMAQARVNEDLRPSNGGANEYHGIPGSFKTLNVD